MKKKKLLDPPKNVLKISHTIVPKEFEKSFPIWDKPKDWKVKYI